MKNKTVIVTGASSGIGAELSRRLICDYGCTVYGIARRVELLEKMRDTLGEKFIVTPLDVSKKVNWTALVSTLESEGVVIDTLINCAGILPKFASVENSSSDDVICALEVNFYSQVYATETLLPVIKKSTQGAIISFSSSSALCTFAGVSAYCASKSASRAYFECMARENKSLYVATVMNGFVKTDIMKNQNASENDARLFMKVCADLDKTVKKILRKIKRRKARIVVGIDAHLMSFFYRLFPNLTPKIISKILKKTSLEIFKDI